MSIAQLSEQRDKLRIHQEALSCLMDAVQRHCPLDSSLLRCIHLECCDFDSLQDHWNDTYAERTKIEDAILDSPIEAEGDIEIKMEILCGRAAEMEPRELMQRLLRLASRIERFNSFSKPPSHQDLSS